jgi:hypothetical protein
MDWHARFIKVAFAKANRPTQEKFRLIATAQFASVTELLKGASALLHTPKVLDGTESRFGRFIFKRLEMAAQSARDLRDDAPLAPTVS